MALDLSAYFPITDPVLIFSVVLFIILLAPIVFRRYKIPNLIVLILAGVIFGPNGLNVLLRDQSMILFGTVGLLYIMFIAGLEIDMNDFIRNKNRTIIHGFITFIVPAAMSTWVGLTFLDLNWISSLLFASVMSSHTLLAYPIISRLGIVNSRSVSTTVGGTIIADTAALLILAVIANYAHGKLDLAFGIQLVISLVIFCFIIFWGYPKLSRWFFKNFESEGVSQYIFVLALVFLAGFLSHVAGIEPIIGAFLAGLALNRMIPHNSSLMNRIEFVGNAIFIPFFLLSVGMLVNLSILFKGSTALIIAGIMIVVATAGKWIAAWLTQKIFRFSKLERNIIFGLTNARAAAALASVIIGFELGLLSENILNGTVIMILVTCLISTLVVEQAGREQAIVENSSTPELHDVAERILVPVSNPESIEKLIDFSILLKNPKSTEPIYPLVVVPDDHQTQEKVIASNKMLDKAGKHAAASDRSVSPVTRVDMNVASGIIRAMKDLMITQVIIGWNARHTAQQWIFGSVLDNLLERSGKMILVTNLVGPLNSMSRIVTVIPPNAEFESGFTHWINTLKTLARQTAAKISFHGNPSTLSHLKQTLSDSKTKIDADYAIFNDWDNFERFADDTKTDDLFVVISAREGSVSHNSVLDHIPKQLGKHFSEFSFVVVYPEQIGLINDDPIYFTAHLKH